MAFCDFGKRAELPIATDRSICYFGLLLRCHEDFLNSGLMQLKGSAYRPVLCQQAGQHCCVWCAHFATSFHTL